MLFLEFDIFKNNLIAEYYSEDQIVNLNDLEDYEKVAAAIKARGKAKSLKGIEYDGFYKLKTKNGEFKHEVRQFEKSYDNQQAEQISLMV